MTYGAKLAEVVAAKDRLARAMPRNPDVLALGQAVDALVKSSAPHNPSTNSAPVSKVTLPPPKKKRAGKKP